MSDRFKEMMEFKSRIMDIEIDEQLNGNSEMCLFEIERLQRKEIEFDKYINDHKHLTVIDCDADKLFEKIFVDMVEKIGMDGNKCFSAKDFEYYKKYFNKGIKLISWQIT